MSRGGPELKQSFNYEHLFKVQIEAICAHAKRLDRPLSILEAGCGQCWPLDLSGVAFTLTGVDLDPAALEMRKNVAHDLDVAICGDLCTIELPEAGFDVIFSSFVLEHVERADLALENFVKWLRRGGIMILRLPERKTVHGFYARVLPHWTHVWYYRYVHGNRFAGLPGYAPYPTYHHPVIGCEHLIDFLADRGMTLLSCHTENFKDKSGRLIKTIERWFFKLTAVLSLSALTADYKDFLYIGMKSDPSLAPIPDRFAKD